MQLLFVFVRLMGTKAWRKPGWRRQFCAALLLLAFLPTLTFLGHWDDTFGAGPVNAPASAALFDLNAQQADQAEHALHCHTNLGSCSTPPFPSGLGLLSTHDTLLIPPPLRFDTAIAEDAGLRADWIIAPLPPPPRATL